jgi:hypothetical protein
MPGVTTQVKEAARDLKDSAQQATRDVKEQAKQKVSDAASQLQSKASAIADEQRSRAADYVGSLAGAVREAGHRLEGEETGRTIAPYADKLAGQLEGFANYFRDRDLRELLRDTEDFGRRHPEVFIGGALLLGFALARFLKSNREDAHGYGEGGGAIGSTNDDTQSAGRDYERYGSSESAGSLEAGPGSLPTVGGVTTGSTIGGPEGV